MNVDEFYGAGERCVPDVEYQHPTGAPVPDSGTGLRLGIWH